MSRIDQPPLALATLCALGVLTGCASTSFPAPPSVAPAASRAALPDALNCQTLEPPGRPSFNEVTSINDRGDIVGHDTFGSYILYPPYRRSSYRGAKYPGSGEGFAAAFNDRRVLVGWTLQNSIIWGFIRIRGLWTLEKGPGSIIEFLDINDAGAIVGFYTARNGREYAFRALPQHSARLPHLRPPGAVNAVAAGINRQGEVVGFLTRRDGVTEGFLFDRGRYREFSYPGATATSAFGINANEEIVGSYVDAHGATHGFTLNDPSKPQWQSFDYPQAVGETVLSSINDRDDLVGYYLNAAGDTRSFICS